MIREIIFPANTGQRYYSIHYQYLLDIFRCGGYIDINFFNISEPYKNTIKCVIDNKEVLFDYNDDNSIEHLKDNNLPCFKFHCIKEYDNIFSFFPVCFYYDNWIKLDEISNKINYNVQSNIILNCQRAYGKATDRRNNIQELLKNKYGNLFDTEITDQQTYWEKINNCLCHVFIPGYSNNMLDRAQTQAMTFGCCTISPEIPELLCGYKLQNGIHYIKCENDYSDIIDKIEWIKNNRVMAKLKGLHAKALMELFNPLYLVNYIEVKLND